MINKTASTILFYYKVTDLWDKVQQHTGMVAKFQPNPEKIAVTSDDVDFFHREIAKGTTKAFELCHKLSTNLIKSVLYNENLNVVNITIEPDATSTPDSLPVYVKVYGFYVKNLLGHYDHALYVIDNYIEKLIIDHFLQAWWLKVGLADYWKSSTADISLHTLDLNNAMYALYKPTITLTPSWTEQEVTVDLETEEETDNTTGETTGGSSDGVNEVEYYDTRDDFPSTGDEEIIYVDRSTNLMYSWNGSTYEVYGGEPGEYEVNYYDTDTLVVTHNLGKMSPYIEGTDSDGNTFEVIWTPTDVNSGTASWNTSGSGILRFN